MIERLRLKRKERILVKGIILSCGGVSRNYPASKYEYKIDVD